MGSPAVFFTSLVAILVAKGGRAPGTSSAAFFLSLFFCRDVSEATERWVIWSVSALRPDQKDLRCFLSHLPRRLRPLEKAEGTDTPVLGCYTDQYKSHGALRWHHTANKRQSGISLVMGSDTEYD